MAREVWCPTSCEVWECAVKWNGCCHSWRGKQEDERVDVSAVSGVWGSVTRSEQSLQALRAVTMVDGSPRACKCWKKNHKSEHIFWSNQWNLLRIVQNSEKICSFRMRYLACPGKFCGKSCEGIKVWRNDQNFMKFDDYHWKSMKFGIEDSNLHSFRQGIRISNSWKLILKKNIGFSSNSDIFREPDFGIFFEKVIRFEE